MKAKELRSKSAQELDQMVTEIRREQFNLKMQKATGQLTKPDQIRKLRRDIARIKTILGEVSK